LYDLDPTPLKHLVLVDFDADPSTWGDAAKTKLIDPSDAIDLLAGGTLTREFPAKTWYLFAGSDLEWNAYSEMGRHELAQELIADAIGAGSLRCAYVIDGSPGSNGAARQARLEVIDPAQFAGLSVQVEWGDEGLRVLADDEDRWFEADKFMFLWDELCRLRPSLAALEKGNRPEPTEVQLPAEPRGHGITARRGKPTRRGRPSGRNGKPIAAFTLRVLQNLADFQAIDTDDPLGLMLIEEYEQLGLHGPNLDNAAKDARGVVEAVMQFSLVEGEIAGRCLTPGSG
jgi:hypothetical protein